MSDDEKSAERKRVPTTDSQYERTKNSRDKDVQPGPRKPDCSGG